jgi:hypothetical protein
MTTRRGRTLPLRRGQLRRGDGTGLTKPELIERVSAAPEGVDRDTIMSVSYHSDWPFLPWRRKSALSLIKPS